MNLNCLPEIHPFTNRWFDFNKPALTSEASAAWVVNEKYFGFLPNRQIKHLIVGSFPIWASVHHNPPHAGFDFAFFYCSRVNRFFEILETISGYDFFPDYHFTTPHQKAQSIANFFLQKQLGITDVLERVQRVDEQCKSALDKHLNPLNYNNLCQLLLDYPEVTHLYFTSTKVEQMYKRQIKKCPVDRTVHNSVLFSPALTASVAAKGMVRPIFRTTC